MNEQKQRQSLGQMDKQLDSVRDRDKDADAHWERMMRIQRH